MPKMTLVGEIVNCEQRGDIFKSLDAFVLDFEIRRDQPRLPIVAMHNIYGQIEQPNGLHDGSREKDESFAIVFVIFAVFAVELFASVIFGLINEVDRYITAWQMAFQQLAGNDFSADRDIKLEPCRLDGDVCIVNLPKCWHDYGDILVEACQFNWQGTAYIGETARFCERGDFTCRDENIHHQVPYWELLCTPFLLLSLFLYLAYS